MLATWCSRWWWASIPCQKRSGRRHRAAQSWLPQHVLYRRACKASSCVRLGGGGLRGAAYRVAAHKPAACCADQSARQHVRRVMHPEIDTAPSNPQRRTNGNHGPMHLPCRVVSITTVASANATLECALGKEGVAACGSHCVPRPATNGRSTAKKCRTNPVSSKAIAMAKSMRSTRCLDGWSPVITAPTTAPATSSGK